MAWKATESEKVVTVAASAIKWAQWLRVARNFQLRIGTVVENKNGSKDQRKEKFDGFQREVGRNTEEKMDRIKLNLLFLRIMIKSLRYSKTISESPLRRAKFHSRVGIGA